MANYNEKVTAKENLCLSYMHNADEAREENDYIPSKKEFYYLRQAAQIRSELAKMSVGEERVFHTRKLRELTERINEVARYLDPEGYEAAVRRRKEARLAEENKSAVSVSGGSTGRNAVPNKTPVNNRDEISEETVESWYAERPKHSFNDVAGMPALKEKLIDCALRRQHDELKAYLDMPKIHSYFFYGPPGCGKTYIIRAFAHELMTREYTYLYMDAAKIMSSMVSIAEKKIARLFEEAKKKAPCIVFIDEIDSVCKDRNQPYLPEYAASLTTAFLTAYNGLSEMEKPVIFIGATNFPDQVDDAMLDRVELVYVDLPDAEARAHVLEMKIDMKGKVSLEDGFSYLEMGEKTPMYSYRDIDRLVASVKNVLLKEVTKVYADDKQAVNALKSGEYQLTRAHFEEALSTVTPSMKDDVLENMRKWREKIDNAHSK